MCFPMTHYLFKMSQNLCKNIDMYHQSNNIHIAFTTHNGRVNTRILFDRGNVLISSITFITRQIKSRRMRWVRHVERMGEESVQGFGWKARRKIPLGRPRC
jgi:hypothetical protein